MGLLRNSIAAAASAVLLLIEAFSPNVLLAQDSTVAAVALLNGGKVDPGIQMLNRLIVTDPKNRVAYLHLAVAYLETVNQPENAVLTINQALRYFPDDPAFHSLSGGTNMSLARRSLGLRQTKAALEQLDSARKDFQFSIDNGRPGQMKGAAWLGIGSAWQLSAEILTLNGKTFEASRARESASTAYNRAVTEHPPLSKEIRGFMIDLALPPVRFLDAYATGHVSTSLQERISRVQAHLVASTGTQ